MSKTTKNLKILYEDNHVLGIMKTPGWLSQGDRTGDESVLDWAKDYVKHKYNKPGKVYMGCVHRLDRPSSGVMIYAKTSKALKRLNREFAERKTDKRYMAIVQGEMPRFNDQLIHYLKKDRKTNKVKAYNKSKPKTQKAILQYTLVGEINGMFLLDIKLETGRPHQIRTQLAQKGFPIVGDTKYGAMHNLKQKEIALHCYKLSVKHPTKDTYITLKSKPLHIDPWRKFEALIGEMLKA